MINPEPDTISGDTAAAIEAGRELGALEIREIDGIPVALIPKGREVQSLEQFRATPRDIRTTVRASDAESFIDYYERFSTDHSVIYCDIKAGIFQAHLDYHQPTHAANDCHLLTLAVEPTPEWTTWLGVDGHSLSQTEFAGHIEDNIDEIVDPDGATMLEIAQSLTATTKVNFTSGTRLTDGQAQISYVEEINGSAGPKGSLKIPATITLGITPFRGADPYALAARFRYRINHAELFMWYDLKRPEKVFEAAISDVAALIVTGTGCELMINCRGLTA